METEKLRYTGDNPPIEVLKRFPNWEYALDEEDIEGQDETTIRPSSVQEFLAPDAVFTLGWLTLANGTRLPAFLEVNNGKIEGATAFTNGVWAWTIRLLGKPARWSSINFDWLPESERPPVVSLNDVTVFPLLIESHLPTKRGGNLVHLTLPKSE